MSQALISRPSARAARATERTRIAAMTCDIPVAGAPRGGRSGAPVDSEVCRPTGRGPRRAAGVESTRRGVEPQWEARARGPIRRSEPAGAAAPAAVGRRSNTDAVFRRRRHVAGALAVGAVLAGLVWILSIVAGSYEDAITPDVPSATQVVHVRTGESLSDVAHRIAPDLPAEGVVEQLRRLNGLETAGLRVSQPLIAPAY